MGKFLADQCGTEPEGAFAQTVDNEGWNHGDTTRLPGVTFDASRCSSQYVSDAILQVSALQTLVCIKV